jgi:hypothetical protein
VCDDCRLHTSLKVFNRTSLARVRLRFVKPARMDQKHQVFAIARIRLHGESTAKYRCVAASSFHHQPEWRDGRVRLPLAATHRFLTLIRQKDNAEIIREELRQLDGKFGRWKQQSALPGIACPYVAFLLGSTWTLDLNDLNDFYISGVSPRNGVLSANTGGGDSGKCCLPAVSLLSDPIPDNNDGISIIDITNPTSPAYCFVFLGERIPLSAEDYVRKYFPEPDPSEVSEMTDEDIRFTEESVLETIAMLKGQTVMTWDMLVEAWPAEYEPSAQKALQLGKASSNPTAPTTTAIPTLAVLSFGPAIKNALLNGDTTDIEGLIWMPGKEDVIKRVLQEQSPFPDAGLNLLVKVSEKKTRNEPVLDLSDLHLSSDQIIKLAMDIKGFEVLNLSRNTSITVQIIHDILSTFPQVKRIVLLGCTAISDADLYHLVSTEPKLFYHIEAIIHPAFLHAKNEAPYKSSFTYIGLLPGYNLVSAFSLPFVTPFFIVQALIDILGPLTSENVIGISAFLQQPMAAQSALAGLPRNEGQTWNQRSVAMLPLPSLKAFDGEGWTFALNHRAFFMDPNLESFYGFLRFRAVPPEVQAVEGKNKDKETLVKEPSIPSCELHNLSSFLNEMMLEGRPVPPAHAVSKLEKIIKTLEEANEIRFIRQSEVENFVDTVRRFHTYQRGKFELE